MQASVVKHLGVNIFNMIAIRLAGWHFLGGNVGQFCVEKLIQL